MVMENKQQNADMTLLLLAPTNDGSFSERSFLYTKAN